ncbi:MAG TPA: hypothetical protein VGK89_01835 [Candidatus Eisenbacteria bacterium]|jgi:hypothetical protein
MVRNRILGNVLACALLTTIAGVAFAQGQYDAPSLTLVDRGYYRLTFSVTAGPSGAPNGYAIQWMKRANYELYGGWPADGSNVVYCDFVGAPTLNLWAGSPLLGPNETASFQAGDLFDETNIEGYSNDTYLSFTDELAHHTDYVFRAYARGDANNDASAFSSTVFASTLLAECTQGFWKNHPELWPPGCTPMLLGTVSYTQAELLKIYSTPANGNGLISLAHQLITAKLNLCNGSTYPAEVQQAVNDADALIDGQVVPTVGSGFLAPSQTSDLTETLDDYNNGLLGGVANCPTSVKNNTTWGRLKALYR